MLRLCFFIPAFSDGGAQKQCIFLLNALQQNPDLDITLIRFRDGVHDHLLQTAGLRLVTLGNRSNTDPRIPFRVANVLRRSRTDIIVTWLISADLHGFFARTLAANGVKWIIAERNSAAPPSLRFWLRLRLGQFADAVISNSVFGADQWARFVRPDKLFVVPNIVRPPSQVSSSRRGAIAYAGRLEPHKNVMVTAAAFCKLAARRADLTFEIIGAGSLEAALQTVIGQSDRTARVKLTGFIPDLPGYLSGVRALVSLSRHEGMPNVLLEAAAAGIPILASDIPEHRALLGETYPYLIQTDAPPHAVAALIEKLIDDPLAAEALVPARNLMRSMTEDAVSARYVEIFRHVVGSAAP